MSELSKRIDRLLLIDVALVLAAIVIIIVGNCTNAREIQQSEEVSDRMATQEEIDYWTKPKAEEVQVAINSNRPKLTKSIGVYWAQDVLDMSKPGVKTTMKETWYGTAGGVHYMTNLMTIDENGFYRYMDNGVNCYVVAVKGVAHGTHILISDGECEAIVLDTPQNYGVVDIYVSWEV